MINKALEIYITGQHTKKIRKEKKSINVKTNFLLEKKRKFDRELDVTLKTKLNLEDDKMMEDSDEDRNFIEKSLKKIKYS